MNLRWVHAFFAVIALALIVGVISIVLIGGTPGGTNVSPPISGPPTSPVTGLPTSPGSEPPDPLPTDQSTQPGQTIAPCRPAKRTPLTVVSINIHGAVARDDSYQLRRLAEEIRSWDADVVLLQEIHRYRRTSAFEDQPLQLATLLDMNVSFGRNFTRAPEAPGRPRRESGTAILSRLPIRATGNVPLPNQPGLQQRGLSRIVVQLGGQTVDIYNTHLQHTAGDIRVVQARGIEQIIAGQPARPFILGGDFNATPGSAAMAVVGGFATDAWPESGAGTGLTVPPRAPRRRIDYLLYNGPWRPLASDVLPSAVADHRAVRTQFELVRTLPC
ncbi:hypothetical protein GCM10027020_17250 [Nocardioides salsibiostraticola]